MERPRILITRCNGLIGSILRQALKDEYQVFGIDKQGRRSSKIAILDASELDKLTLSFKEFSPIDQVIHLAADSRADAPLEAVLKNNIVVASNVYECASEFGVRRVILASSNHVTGALEGFPPTLHLHRNSGLIIPGDPKRPDDYYGWSKAAVEDMARMFHDRDGIESICLRIGSVILDDDPRLDCTLRMRKTWLSHRDLVQLFQKALKSNVQFGIYYGVSDNQGRFWDISNAEVDLGYYPEDNASKLM